MATREKTEKLLRVIHEKIINKIDEMILQLYHHEVEVVPMEIIAKLSSV